MKPKVFFIIVGLLVVLLIFGIGLGALQQRDSDEAVEIPSWSDSLRKRLEQRLRAKDVRTTFPSDCRDQLLEEAFVLAQGESCTLIIAQSSIQVRTFTVELTQGSSASVVMYPGGENQLTSRQTLENGEEAIDDETVADVSVFKEGGTLEIRCNSGGPCRLDVVK